METVAPYLENEYFAFDLIRAASCSRTHVFDLSIKSVLSGLCRLFVSSGKSSHFYVYYLGLVNVNLELNRSTPGEVLRKLVGLTEDRIFLSLLLI